MSNRLPKPIRKQREVLYLPETGHSAILGTAGSGKTTLALYRAAYLSSEDMPHYGPTLLLTFNRALVVYLKHLKHTELRNVTIENYHKFARGYLHSRGKMEPNSICDPNLRHSLIETALNKVRQSHPKPTFLARPISFFLDEIQWILSHGIETEDEYKKVKRVGRMGTKLQRNLRGVMFEILTEYLKLRSQRGKLYDWDDIAYYVHQEYLQDNRQRRYRHIIIDEGQDFSPEMIRSLVSAIPDDGSLTFFGDVAQQIYGQRTSWRSANLSIPQVWEFKENYRNTQQIAQLGLAISKMPYFQGIADIVEPTFPKPAGSLPTLVECHSKETQINIAISRAKDYSGTMKSVAILFKNRQQEKLISPSLPDNSKRLHRDMRIWDDGPGIYYGTYHSSKGLEFDMVILPFLEDNKLPDSEFILSHGEDEALTHFGRLIYVAVTRAKTEVLLLYTGSVTPLLPTTSSLYRMLQS
ncbi:MAG: AAA family ATPase [Bacteroidetes bacterium]|nr:AAA family ATPase [Bacteroidota bacterium]